MTAAMTHRERFAAAMQFQPVDRLPVIEWATWWDKTIERWRGEGLPVTLQDEGEIRDHLGLDCYRQAWLRMRQPTCPKSPSHGAGIVGSMDEYIGLRPHLYPDPPFDPEAVRRWAGPHDRGEMVVWITLEGFFWWPRSLLGIERHMYAFYDQPQLIHQINQDLVAFHLRTLDRFCQILTPDFMTLAEDMSYNNGPMLSRACFDEFLAPYYRQVVPVLRERGILTLVDSDGDVTSMVPWLEAVGVEGLLPWERQSGVDLPQIRRQHPRFRMIGGFDKMVMTQGGAALRREFERLLPVMRSGGFIPGVDHQTPPAVSLAQYREYLALLRQYAMLAAR